jgi:citrate synthase
MPISLPSPFQSTVAQKQHSQKTQPPIIKQASQTTPKLSNWPTLKNDTVSIRFKGGDKPEYKRGLEGVIMDRTRISDVDPEAATLLYRGYTIGDLIEKSNFEETSYLLLNGALPKPTQLAEFKENLLLERPISENMKLAIRQFPPQAHPMDKLKAAVSILALEEQPNDLNSNSLEANQRKAIRLIAKLPTIIAAIHRAEQKQPILDPDPTLSHAENFLYMMSGQKPDPYVAQVFDKTLIAYADHGFNASTTAARVTASTQSDMYSAVQSAIGTLKGPLHGGANEQVMHMLQTIQETPGATPMEKAEAWVMNALAHKQIIMGFGHREYKNGDPRAAILIPEAAKVGERLGKPEWPQLADAVRTVMAREMERKQKQLPPNVDYPIGYLYHMLGLPTRLYTPIFALARVTGWTSHVTELHQDNRLYRPKADYQGEKGLLYQDISERNT